MSLSCKRKRLECSPNPEKKRVMRLRMNSPRKWVAVGGHITKWKCGLGVLTLRQFVARSTLTEMSAPTTSCQTEPTAGSTPTYHFCPRYSSTNSACSIISSFWWSLWCSCGHHCESGTWSPTSGLSLLLSRFSCWLMAGRWLRKWKVIKRWMTRSTGYICLVEQRKREGVLI